MRNYHDKGYKKIFSHKDSVKQLLEYFIEEDFVNELNFDKMTKLNKSFVTDQYKEKEADIIYKIDFRDSQMYIFLLIEFQSTIEKFMALKFLRYICEFYQDLIEHNKNLIKLPAVFPIVIYNGEQKWNSCLNMNELIEHTISKKYIPDFSYYNFSVNELSKKTLSDIKNALSFIFSIENGSPSELIIEMDDLIKRIEKETPESIEMLKLG